MTYSRRSTLRKLAPFGYVDVVAEKDPGSTSGEVFEDDPEDTFTGLFWADGAEIHKEPDRVRLGFISETLD